MISSEAGLETERTVVDEGEGAAEKADAEEGTATETFEGEAEEEAEDDEDDDEVGAASDVTLFATAEPCAVSAARSSPSLLTDRLCMAVDSKRAKSGMYSSYSMGFIA